MKKLILLVGLTFLITGCGNDKMEYYENVSDVVIGFNKDLMFDVDSIEPDDLVAINEYKNNLKNLDNKINLTKLMSDLDSFKTDEVNSKEVYVENGDCFINKDDVNFDYSEDLGPLEDSATYVCNGYMVQVLETDVNNSYEEYVKTRKFGYRYLGYKETDNGYLFGYRSYYDGNVSTIEFILSGSTIKKVDYKENQLVEFE